MNTFFTSDLHWFHKNIIRYAGRPFASVDEMNCALVEQWNSQVQPNDEVFHLGDWCFGGIDKISATIKQLNGRKHFIIGNHDDRKHWARLDKEELGIVWIRTDGTRIKVNDQSIILSHFPYYIWDRMHHGTWNLCGHSHGTAPDAPKKQMDVGIDNALKMLGEMRLFTFDEVKAVMDTKPVPVLDHHTPETN